jgi:hypothetical protein
MSSRTLLFCWALVFGACSTTVSDNPRVGLMNYRDYAASAARSPPQRSLLRRDPHVLRELFQQAFARMQEPYVLGGEDVSSLITDLWFALVHYGDRRFAQALAAESAQTRAAVAWFIQTPLQESASPQTRKVSEEAPSIDFPAVQISNRNA